MLEEFGLWVALRVFIEEFRSRSGLRVSLKITPVLEELLLDPRHEMVLFRVIREALANVHRHSKSKTASVEITMQDSDFIKASVAATATASRPDAGILRFIKSLLANWLCGRRGPRSPFLTRNHRTMSGRGPWSTV